MQHNNNAIAVTGRLEGAPVKSHEVSGTAFYSAVFAVKRMSGAVDRLPVSIPEQILGALVGPYDMPMTLRGEIRTYNAAGRMTATLFAREVVPAVADDTLNDVRLSGVLCRPPILRATPFGKQICDMMLAVTRGFGKCDYIPCVAWGHNAHRAARFGAGDRIAIVGRLQSREYQKLLEEGTIETRTTYEVSCFKLEAISDNTQTRSA